MNDSHYHAVEKHVVVILGMARSGTSAIARGIKALGIELGDKLTPADENWNSKGFWEDKDIVYKINRGILCAFNVSRLPMPVVADTAEKKSLLQDLKSAATALMARRMADVTYWGFKDPRTAKLVPFWQEVFATLGVRDNYVIALRNPLASASSYQKLSGCDLEEALLLWLSHLVSAIDGTMVKPRVIVSYELLMQDPHLQLSRIKMALDIPDLIDLTEMDVYANEFLDKRLHHYEFSEQDLKNHHAMAVVPLCVKVYELLLLVAKDEIKFSDQAFVVAWDSIKAELQANFPVYQYIDTLLSRNKQLERQIRTMQKTVLWKAIYPLRMIDDFFRAWRHKRRVQRRRWVRL